MLRLYVPGVRAGNAQVRIEGPALRHLRTVRLPPGARLRILDDAGGEHDVVLERRGAREAVGRVLASHHPVRESPLELVLAPALLKGAKMDLVVEKATELGVHGIQPLLCERSVLRLAGDRASRKREHWQAIAAAAAEQCARTRVPQVAPVLLLERFLGNLPHDATRVLLSPHDDAAALPAVAGAASSLLTLSGPEGGLTPTEEAAARARGFVAARLGDRVLRAETAPLAVLAWVGLQDTPGRARCPAVPAGGATGPGGGLGGPCLA